MYMYTYTYMHTHIHAYTYIHAYTVGGEQIPGVAVPAGQGQNLVGRKVKEEGA